MARGLARNGHSLVLRPSEVQNMRPLVRRLKQEGASARSVGLAQSTKTATMERSAPLEQRKVAIFVEPSPFSHVSGMKNRFECLIKGLREQGDDVLVFTPDHNPPEDYHGAKVVKVLGFPLPFYRQPTLLLSLGLSVRVLWHLVMTRPTLIHASSPGVMVFAAILYAKLLDLPLVVSYHTHIPEYIPRYTWAGLVAPMWSVIRFCHRAADLTLVTSQAMKQELVRNLCSSGHIDVWQRGVDTDVFHPRHRSREMRSRMTGGNPDAPLLAYVGRLGAEKNLEALKGILEGMPRGTRLAFVGDGPQREALEEHFKGMPVIFMGMLRGQDLSEAYASADVFMMPSESETLGFVVLEAMASGVPVVAVAAGGLTDLIHEPGTTGFLYPPGDYAAATALARRLAGDAALRAKVGAAARAEVERWGWSAATRVLREQQYDAAIRKNSGRAWFAFGSLRSAFARGLAQLLGAIVAVLQWVVDQLDYAKPYRALYDARVRGKRVSEFRPIEPVAKARLPKDE